MLWRLAREHGTTVYAIAQRNGIANPNLIFIGQCLTFGNPTVTYHYNSPAAPYSPAAQPRTAAPASVPVNTYQQPQGGNTGAILTQAALDHGVAPALVKAIAQRETGWNQNARGYSGEIGLMQILPSTAAGLNANHGTSYNVWTTYGNAELGAMFLSDLIAQEHGCVTCAISAYNEGPGNFAAFGFRNWASYVGPVLTETEPAASYGAFSPSG